MASEIWMAGENVINKAKMSVKAYLLMFTLFVTLFLFITFLLDYFIWHNKIWEYAIYIWMLIQSKLKLAVDSTGQVLIHGYYCQLVGSGIDKGHCQWGRVGLGIIKQYNYMTIYGKYLFGSLVKASGISIVISTLIYYFTIYRYFKRELSEFTEDKEVRGRKVIDDEKLLDKRYFRKDNILFINDRIRLSAEEALTHLLILGASGSGKSSLIHRQLEILRERNQKVIVVDFKGEFMQKWYSEGDIIFNPIDERSVKWTITNDIKKINHLKSFTYSFIKEKSREDAVWVNWGRLLLQAIIVIASKEGKRTNKDILRYLGLTYDELVELLMKYRDNSFVASALKCLGNEKQANSVLSMLTDVIDQIALIEDGSFSFRKYISNESDKRWLFVENGEKQVGLEGIFSAVVDTVSNESLQMSEANGKLRHFLIIDELGRYNRSESLERLVTLGRSKGVSIILANQDLSKLQLLYGKEMDVLYNSISTLCVLKINDTFTQEYVVKSIGNIEVERKRESVSMSPSDVRDSISYSTEVTERKAILESELGMLKKGQMIVRFTDGVVLRTSFSYKKYADKLSEDELLVERNLTL